MELLRVLPGPPPGTSMVPRGRSFRGYRVALAHRPWVSHRREPSALRSGLPLRSRLGRGVPRGRASGGYFARGYAIARTATKWRTSPKPGTCSRWASTATPLASSTAICAGSG